MGTVRLKATPFCIPMLLIQTAEIFISFLNEFGSDVDLQTASAPCTRSTYVHDLDHHEHHNVGSRTCLSSFCSHEHTYLHATNFDFPRKCHLLHVSDASGQNIVDPDVHAFQMWRKKA